MKNNLISEINRAKELMGIRILNESRPGLPKFRFKPNLMPDDIPTKKITESGLKKTVKDPTTQADVEVPITSKEEITSHIDDILERSLNESPTLADIKFIKDLNIFLHGIDPNFTKRIAQDYVDTFIRKYDDTGARNPDYVKDPAARKKIENEYKSEMGVSQSSTFDAEIKTKKTEAKQADEEFGTPKFFKFLKAAVGSDSTWVGKLISGIGKTMFGKVLSTVAALWLVGYIFNLNEGISSVIERFSQKWNEKLKFLKGQELFNTLTNSGDDFPDLDAENFAKEFGLTKNLATVRSNATNIIAASTTGLDLTEEEQISFFKQIAKMDGLNYMLFLKAFKEHGDNKNKLGFKEFLEKGFFGMSDAEYTQAVQKGIPADWEFCKQIKGLDNPDEEEIDKLLTLLDDIFIDDATSEKGFNKIYIQKYIGNELKWVQAKDGESYPKTSGGELTLSSADIDNLKKKARELVNTYLEEISSTVTIPTDTEELKQLGSKMLGNTGIIKDLKWDVISKKIQGDLDKEFSTTWGLLSWDWYQNVVEKNLITNESKKIGLSVLLDSKKKSFLNEEKTLPPPTGGGGGGKPNKVPFPGLKGDNPAAIKEFQDWLNLNHPGWVPDPEYPGGKLSKTNKGYGNYGQYTQNAWENHGREYEPNNPVFKGKKDESTKVSRAQAIYNKGSKLVKFFKCVSSGCQPFIPSFVSVESSIDSYDVPEYGFTDEVTYLVAVLSIPNFANQITEYRTTETIQNEIEKNQAAIDTLLASDLVEVRIRRNKGLWTLLEQTTTPPPTTTQPKIVRVQVRKGKPVSRKAQAVKDSYTPNNTTLRQIINGANPIVKGQKGPTVSQVRRRLGLSQSEYFDDETLNALKAYQTENNLGDSGEINSTTICSLFKEICERESGASTQTKQTSQTVDALNRIISGFSSGEKPDYNRCVLLFNTYSEKAKIYMKNKKAGFEETLERTDLDPARKVLNACIAWYPTRLKIRDAKYRTINDDPIFSLGTPEYKTQVALYLDKNASKKYADVTIINPTKTSDNVGDIILFDIDNGGTTIYGQYICNQSVKPFYNEIVLNDKEMEPVYIHPRDRSIISKYCPSNARVNYYAQDNEDLVSGTSNTSGTSGTNNTATTTPTPAQTASVPSTGTSVR